MATHRSLNKLEYKAHMSIHNVADVPETVEGQDLAYTRDRLGRRHPLFEGDGTPRFFGPRMGVWILALCGLFFASAARAIPENIRISTDELEQKDFNDRLGKPEPGETFHFFDDGTNSAGFNDNGDPSVAMKF